MMEYTPNDLAAALNLNPKAVRQYLRNQGIRARKGGRQVLDRTTYERLLRELGAKHASDPFAW